MGYTMTEKILGRASDQDTVRAGENHPVQPARMIAYDFPGYTDVMFRQMREDFGITELKDPSRYIVFIDHMLTKHNEKETEVHQVTRDWCEFYGIELHEGRGIGHQLTAELGLAIPGEFLVHFDGHISGIGAFGALGWVSGATSSKPGSPGRSSSISPPPPASTWSASSRPASTAAISCTPSSIWSAPTAAPIR